MLTEALQAHEDAALLDAAAPDAVIGGSFERGELTILVEPARIVDALRFLKKDRQFNALSNLTAVDWFPVAPRFEVVYHLHSIPRRAWVRVKSRPPAPGYEIDSVTGVYSAAGWYEREAFDLFGVKFRNHPDLRRILLPEDWDGYPLRKDYPKTGPRV